MKLFDDSTTKRAQVAHQLDEDFSGAVRRAFWDELKGIILGKSMKLLPFERVKDKLGIWFVRDMGIQTIPIDKIVGSEGRYDSFTRKFLPLKEDLRDRWKSIVRAHYHKRNLPPVELYKVGGAYFVRDGHHRISVARAKGVRDCDARVFEYECDVPLDEETNLEKLAIQETYHQFLEITELKKNRPYCNLQISLLGGYPILMEHIQAHKHWVETEFGKAVSILEAAHSWYDLVYLPIVNAIRKNGILKAFPHRTETDFYLWVIRNRRELKFRYWGDQEAENAVEVFSKKYGNSLRKTIGALRRFFGLVRY